MKLSFVIPLYNCLPLTQAMLKSLRETMPDGIEHEIIFVDDGSTDGTREWLQTLSETNVRLVLNESNVGYAAANNRGIASARGEILALLNNDVLLTHNWLPPLLELHGKLQKPGAIGNVQRTIATGAVDHAGIFINEKGKPEHARNEPFWLQREQRVTAVTGACLIISHTLWRDLKGFDEDFVNGCEDVDLCLRALAHRCENAVALNSTIYHHVSASPGRKLRDEANTRRLTLRWRDELELRGARRWCEVYIERELTAASAFQGPTEAAKIFAHALGLTREAPEVALSGIHAAVEKELVRWETMLGQA